MVITKRIIASFCFGSDSAINSVKAARPVSLITGSLRAFNKRPLRFKKFTNRYYRIQVVVLLLALDLSFTLRLNY